MPIYEYECQACEHLFSEYQKLSDKPLKKCPECKKLKLIKIISLTGRPVVPGDPMQQFMDVKREAKEIAQRIVKGDEQAIADVYGEEVAAGKAAKQAEIKKKPLNPKGKVKTKNGYKL